ncbi:SGNH/GDSL hydrolase family protein [Agrobacterium phage OLIVR5]|uniref:SGNH/GDSL hydrolase family protein n=1 Tax=Agrobacterium phage OLIVR5 TaxID=2723773 RepID=A0A858MS97_9CAUD|nr:SGNH/GDSL hydrolase family protein [Agrobacterium phage OLIVR5]QIW87657.1 SGNH/GDSL hydrolase family protein [Agrobacterium phage OLIVR5]QIW87916.1 SGNH/GDSL hydrolase family protein [Agrobacterium phage OLIVR6]
MSKFLAAAETGPGLNSVYDLRDEFSGAFVESDRKFCSNTKVIEFQIESIFENSTKYGMYTEIFGGDPIPEILEFDETAVEGQTLTEIGVAKGWELFLTNTDGNRVALKSSTTLARGATPLNKKTHPDVEFVLKTRSDKTFREKSFSAIVRSETAWSPLRKILEENGTANVFINGDSTAYPIDGQFAILFEKVGEYHDATIVIHQWAEWNINTANGPMEYKAPVIIREGNRGTVHVWLAAVPGGMAGYMFAGIRSKALDVPKPDLIIMCQGHNMQSFETPSGPSRLVSGKSAFLGPIGMTCLKWPGVPQIITTQNPRRSDTGYTKVREAILEICASLTDLYLEDTYLVFESAGKPVSWYTDNVHPNKLGSTKIAEYLFESYRRSSPKDGFETEAWPLKPVTGNLFIDPSFNNWTAAVPANWNAQAPATAVKDVDNKWNASFPYSMSVLPNGNQNAGVIRYIRTTELTPMLGKRVTAVVLYETVPEQRNATVSFVVKSGGGSKTLVGASLQFGGAGTLKSAGKMMAVFHDVLVDADIDPNSFTTYFSIRPAFGTSAPTSAAPIRIQKIIIVEGDKPRIGL